MRGRCALVLLLAVRVLLLGALIDRQRADVAFARRRVGIAEHFERPAHDATPARSSATFVRTAVNVSGDWAPDTPYLPSTTKNGTPWMP